MPPKKKEEEREKDMIVEFGFVILVLIFLWIIWSTILSSFTGSLSSTWAAIAAWFRHFIWPLAKVLGLIISILAVGGIINIYRKLVKLNKEEDQVFGAGIKHDGTGTPTKEKSDKWERVIAHVNSVNPSDWRLGIIEADIMLDELLRAMGYHGDSIGDMLKGVDKSDMLTLDAAWEAHKVRNQIAHGGADFQITERDVKRVSALYESVFKEFKVI